MSIEDRIRKLEQGRTCPACAQAQGVALVGIPAKPGHDLPTYPTREDVPVCPVCGAPPVHIKIRGLDEKPGGGALRQGAMTDDT
jgi:hypothetical protein